MFIWKLIETVYNIAVILAYVSAGLWIMAFMLTRSKNKESDRHGKKYKKGENVDKV